MIALVGILPHSNILLLLTEAHIILVIVVTSMRWAIRRGAVLLLADRRLVVRVISTNTAHTGLLRRVTITDVRRAGVLRQLVVHQVGVGVAATLATQAGEETRLATRAGGVVVGGRGAIALLLLAMADEDDFHEGREDKDNARENWSLAISFCFFYPDKRKLILQYAKHRGEMNN